ncbi:MAG: hypothetical protein P8L23_05530 [Flavobacteriales bacterium]|nr:hypothetical protein [Flavobacteriales bacterium]
MKIKSIKTTKTARYILSGEPSKNIKHLWIVCHGYGQSALGFLNWFKPIFCEETLIVAPEGLSMFYLEGFNGKVVSSWMTKENRENEINDYINYIENVVNEIKPKLNKNIKYNVLGFSQGTATISRWANQTDLNLNSINLWSGLFPDDLLNSWKKNILPKLNLIIGDMDPFISEKSIDQQKIKLTEKGIDFNIETFNGKHTIDSNTLIKLKHRLQNP